MNLKIALDKILVAVAKEIWIGPDFRGSPGYIIYQAEPVDLSRFGAAKIGHKGNEETLAAMWKPYAYFLDVYEPWQRTLFCACG